MEFRGVVLFSRLQKPCEVAGLQKPWKPEI